MKKIIAGKRYDTETATLVASNWNGLPDQDFRNQSESLFLTKAGSWFLVGEGGALSKYAICIGNSAHGGEKLIPLSRSEAFELLQSWGKSKAAEEHFGNEIVDA
jgi:hypothetical protein